MAASHDFVGGLHEQMVNDPEGYGKRHKAAQTLFGHGDPNAQIQGESRLGYIPSDLANDPRRYRLGLGMIDDLAGEIGAAELVAIGGSTGFGKSGLGERIAITNAKAYRVAYVSLEMPSGMVQDRILAKVMMRNAKMIAKLRNAGDAEFSAGLKIAFGLDLLINHPAPKDRTIQRIQGYAEDVSADMLIIDYADKISKWKAGDPASEIVDELWEWIKSTRITTTLLAQVKRPSVAGAKRYRPTIHDFSDTRAIENSATRAIMLFRPFHGRPGKDTIAEIIYGKNRFGPEFMQHAHWIPECTDFFPMNDDDDANAPCCKRQASTKRRLATAEAFASGKEPPAEREPDPVLL